MSDVENKVNQLFEKGAETTGYAKAYMESQVELKKIEASKIAGSGVTGVLTSIVSVVALAGMFFFLMAALAVFLSEVLGSFIYAFLIVAATILVSLLIYLFLFRPLIKKYSTKAIAYSITGGDVPNDDSIEAMKKDSEELKSHLKETAQEIPETLKLLSPKDFIPEKVNLSQNDNPNLKTKLSSFVLNQAIKLLKKKL